MSGRTSVRESGSDCYGGSMIRLTGINVFTTQAPRAQLLDAAATTIRELVATTAPELPDVGNRRRVRAGSSTLLVAHSVKQARPGWRLSTLDTPQRRNGNRSRNAASSLHPRVSDAARFPGREVTSTRRVIKSNGVSGRRVIGLPPS